MAIANIIINYDSLHKYNTADLVLGYKLHILRCAQILQVSHVFNIDEESRGSFCLLPCLLQDIIK